MPRVLLRGRQVRPVCLALLCSLGLLWLNFLTTSRWAHVDGSLHGPRKPFFVLALLSATLAAAWWTFRHGSAPGRTLSPTSAWLLGVGGSAVLAASFYVWFPPDSWHRIPFLDDWPIRYQAAVDMMRLLDKGTFTGWEWRFLGGYHSSSDATQGLGTLTYLPMKLLGPQLGFHATHLVLFALVPLLLWRDLTLAADSSRPLAATAAGLAGLTAAGYGYFLIRSGDTNSLGGVVATLATLVAAHAARLGSRWGTWGLAAGLTLTAYAHPGFFAYASLYLLLDSAAARDKRAGVRAAIAMAGALAASLPLTWETWRYPSFFQFNNVVYDPPPFDPRELVRQIYYNVELLVQPWRWFNDFIALAWLLVPVAIALVWVDRSRVRFYALALILTLALLRLHNVYAGYVFLRPVHMLAVFVAPIAAALVAEHVQTRWLRWSLVGVFALYLQFWWHPVPHLESIREFDAALVDRVATAPGALVLLENNPHRNMNAEPGGRTEPSRFGTHFEVMVAEETGRRLYSGGYSDGWQWNPWKGQVVAGGTFMGLGLAATPHDVFVKELRRWGVSDLLVWSETAVSYLEADDRFETVARDERWTHFRLAGSDLREVVTSTGSGRLDDRHPHGAQVRLTGVRLGDRVIVRTNFHPAWTAEFEGAPIPLVPYDGQLSLAAPCDGDCQVTLIFPSYRGLIWLAPLAVVTAALTIRRFDRGRRRHPQH